MGDTSHLRLNNDERPIANKYREGKMKRTLKRESKVREIVKREAMAVCWRWSASVSIVGRARDGVCEWMSSGMLSTDAHRAAARTATHWHTT